MDDHEAAAAVTVLIAAYRSRYLLDALRSLIAQTFSSFEAIVLDDANDDTTKREVLSLGDPRITYSGNLRNLGPALNHAHGIAQVRTDYVLILNHDDLLEPTALERLHATAVEHPECGAIFSRTLVADASGVFSAERTRIAWSRWEWESIPIGLIPDWARPGQTRLGIPTVDSALLSTDALRSIRIPRAVGGSYDYWLGYRLGRDRALFHLDEPIALWREHEDNLTSSRSANRVLESAYLNGVAVLDGRLPATMRMRAGLLAARSVLSAGKLAVQNGVRAGRATR